MMTGKEALIALANGEDVEVRFKSVPDAGWYNVGTTKIQSIQKILEGGDEFRLKPRTISINGIEVPACGENYKEGEEVYVLDDCCDERGYIEYSVSGHNFEGLLPKLWWRTESEIKQVVAALRSIFK